MDSATPISNIKKLRRLADGPPRQDVFFERELAMSTERWAYRVLVSMRIIGDVADPMLEGEWTGWTVDWEKPNHFRSHEGAVARLAERKEAEARKIKLGLLQFKIEPKYIGCIPDKDEAWISD